MPALAGTHKEVPVEQQSGAAGSAQAQAARTILPGEPFDPPAASQVPGPRPAGQAPVPAEAPEAPAAFLPPPAWNYQPTAAPEAAPVYQPLAAPEGAPVYQSLPATHAEPQPFGGDFDTLHDFANLPAAAQFATPAPATEYPAPPAAFAPAAYPPPPAAYSPEAAAYPPPPADAPVFAAAPSAAAYPPPPVFAPSEDALPPLPPIQEDEGLLGEPDKKGSGRKSPDKRLLAVALVAVLAGGGYFGYTQLNKKSSSTTANPPVVAPVTTPVVHYNFPSNVAGFKLQPASAAFTSGRLAVAKQWSPVAATSMTAASYSAGHPYIVSMAFHPASAQLASDFASLVRFTATPSKGSVEVASHVAIPGAAGGQMTCGGEQGATTLSWCVWQGTKTVGMLQIEGTPKTQITEIVTRELRASAEH